MTTVHFSKRAWRLITLLGPICLFLLVGCGVSSPLMKTRFVDGYLLDYGIVLGQFTRPGAPDRTKLDDSQLRSLHTWSLGLNADWRMLVAPPPPPSARVIVESHYGARLDLEIYASPSGWKNTLIARAFSNGKEDIGIARIADESMEELLRILRTPQSHLSPTRTNLNKESTP